MSESESKSVFQRMQEIAAAGGVTVESIVHEPWVNPSVIFPSNPPPGAFAEMSKEPVVNRRHRRTQAQMIADGDKPAPVVTPAEPVVLAGGVVSVPLPSPTPAVVSVSEPTAAWVGIDTLYINCMPLFEFTAFFELLRDAKATMGCDYRLGEANAFGRGGAHLVEAVGIAVQTSKPTNVVIDTNSPEANICLEMLKGVSKNIVIGTR